MAALRTTAPKLAALSRAALARSAVSPVSCFHTTSAASAASPAKPEVDVQNPKPVSVDATLPSHAAGAENPSLTAPQSGDVQSAIRKQAPNRAGVWSTSQRSRLQAMTGPRFEQTNLESQPQPYSAMELIHQQPVRWTHEKVVVCDGGNGPAGHPRIFINTDKPQICVCNYCGVPYANEHHRKHLESLPKTSYPLQ